MKINSNLARYSTSGGIVNLTDRWSLIYFNSASTVRINAPTSSGRYIVMFNNDKWYNVTCSIFVDSTTLGSVICVDETITYLVIDTYNNTIKSISWPRP